MAYDILIVGCGLSAATIAACVKHRYKVCVVDTRSHIGGNCYDYRSSGTYIHQYGPHIFHSPSLRIVDFLSQYTSWTNYKHSCTAEIEWNGKLCRVPFPYSQETERAIGRPLSEQEVLEKFFHGYSRKMWDVPYDLLPSSVKKRVPKNTDTMSEYFPQQFQGMPSQGYTAMMEKMLDGTTVCLGVDPEEWTSIEAERVVYCGRVDKLRRPDGTRYGVPLPFRSLKIEFAFDQDDWGSAILNFCHHYFQFTRKVRYGRFYEGNSCNIIGYETPFSASDDDLSPFYPIPYAENFERNRVMQAMAAKDYPHMIFAGRLASYQYFDMYQVVAQAIELSKKHFEVSNGMDDSQN